MYLSHFILKYSDKKNQDKDDEENEEFPDIDRKQWDEEQKVCLFFKISMKREKGYCKPFFHWLATCSLLTSMFTRSIAFPICVQA